MVRSVVSAEAEVIVLGGPTASGKSGLALALAEALAGTIVCGDSRQLYAGMQIGAAGPTDDELRRVPHRGFATVAPEEVYDAGRFIEDTDTAVTEAHAAGRVPIVVGGSGLYLRAWRYGLDDVPGGDPAVRAELERRRDHEGLAPLFAELARVDPASAAKFGPNDPVRIVRALEVFRVTGERASARRQSHLTAAPRVRARWLLLDGPLDWLTPRLERRARAMFEGGLVEEALALRARLGAGHRLLATMGYEEALALHDGELEREAAIERTVRRQRQYAKRQRTWFKKETWWERLDPTRDDLLARARSLLEPR